MPSFPTIDGDRTGATAGGESINLEIFEATDHASMTMRILVACRDPATGAAKSWDITALIKREGATVTLAQAVNTSPLGAAADLTALAGATVAFYVSGANIGITCTGVPNVPLAWGLSASGRQLY